MRYKPGIKVPPTSFPLKPEDCSHEVFWYVMVERNICGTCGTELSKPANGAVYGTGSTEQPRPLIDLVRRMWLDEPGVL